MALGLSFPRDSFPQASMTSISSSRPERISPDAFWLYLLVGLGVLGSVFATAFSTDAAFRFHGYTDVNGGRVNNFAADETSGGRGIFG